MNALVEAPAPRGLTEASVVAGAPIKSLVPTSLEGAWRVAQLLAASPFTPNDMKQPEACAAAIMFGMDLGITPVQAVQSIAVINGRPSIWGDLALALVRADKRCEDVEEVITGQDDKRVATCTARRAGSKPTVRSFSVDDAKKASLWGKAGPWQQYPARMLQLRARAFALRDAFPDILKGISIREEVEDISKDAPPSPPPPPAPSAPMIEDAQFAEPKIAAAEVSSPSEVTQDAGAPPPPSNDDPASDPVFSETISPDDILANLAEVLATATDAAAIEEGYSYLDVEAELSGFDGYVEKARALKDEHLARVEKAKPAADEAPAPPPALADDEAGQPPSEDKPVDLNGWRELEHERSYIGYAELLVDHAKKVGDFAIVETFWTDSQPVRAKLIPLKERNSLKDALLARWQKA
jgi:hypothetical protein